MNGNIFIIQDTGKLIHMSEQEYDSEHLLQELLAQYPSLLAGEQINPENPRKWLFISREVSIPSEEDSAGRWYVDHLLIDQDSIPTLVEVKRSQDTRIRREVVGQMLEYASNAVVYWPFERIKAFFETTCEKAGLLPEQQLSDFLDDEDPEEFWDNVKTNLQAGKLRLIFVADSIPSELKRIVEFLNSQMDPAEVLAIEIKQYVGEGMKTLVPRVLGTIEKKEKGGRKYKQWDESSFFAELGKTKPHCVDMTRKIYAWLKARMSEEYWGRGARWGSYIPGLKLNEYWHQIIGLWTYGVIELRFQEMMKNPPFDDEKKREELLEKFNTALGVNLEKKHINLRPSIPLETIEDETILHNFFEVIEWFITEVKTHHTKEYT